jgi:hypothetical protein
MQLHCAPEVGCWQLLGITSHLYVYFFLMAYRYTATKEVVDPLSENCWRHDAEICMLIIVTHNWHRGNRWDYYDFTTVIISVGGDEKNRDVLRKTGCSRLLSLSAIFRPFSPFLWKAFECKWVGSAVRTSPSFCWYFWLCQYPIL